MNFGQFCQTSSKGPRSDEGQRQRLRRKTFQRGRKQATTKFPFSFSFHSTRIRPHYKWRFRCRHRPRILRSLIANKRSDSIPKTVSWCSSIPSLTPVSHTITKWCREKPHTARVSNTGSPFSTFLSHTNIILDLILSAPESNKKRSFMMFGNYREFDYINKVTWLTHRL